MLSHIVFGVSIISAMAILLLSIGGVITKRFQFWPPPKEGSWQHKTFRLLFRGFIYPLIALTALEFDMLHGQRALFQYIIGGFLFTTGIGLAFWITIDMGWRNAFGVKMGLRTSGCFEWSRNPVYVVTWAALLGWGLIANSVLVSALLAVWALFYFIAPHMEEPWLEQEYGDDYKHYKSKTPRFI